METDAKRFDYYDYYYSNVRENKEKQIKHSSYT